MVSILNWLKGKYYSLKVEVRASLWFLFCTFLQKGISGITTPIFTRLLTSAEYGQFSVYNSWMSIITIFVSFNLSSGVYMQGRIKFESRSNEFTSSLQGLCLTLASLWTLIYWSFRTFWNHLFGLTTIQMMMMLLTIWLGTVFGFWSSEQRIGLQYRRLVAVTLLASILNPVLGIFLVTHTEDKVTARILSIALVDLAAYGWMFFVQVHRGGKFYSSEFWKYAIRFNLPLVPHYLSMSILNSADRIMISRMVGDSAAGIYSLAYSVSLIMTMFNNALMQTIEPWLYKKIHEGRIREMSKIVYPVFLVIVVVNLLLIALAPEVIAVFAPPQYYEAIWVIPPVAMSVYFMFAYFFFAVFEFYFEKTNYIMAATMIGAILNIILNRIFIGMFGYIAAGYTTLVCYMLYAIFHFLFMRKICSKQFDGCQPYSMRQLSQITVVFMAAGFVFLLTYKLWILRYTLLVGMLFLLLACRRRIVANLKMIMTIRHRDSH